MIMLIIAWEVDISRRTFTCLKIFHFSKENICEEKKKVQKYIDIRSMYKKRYRKVYGKSNKIMKEMKDFTRVKVNIPYIFFIKRGIDIGLDWLVFSSQIL